MLFTSYTFILLLVILFILYYLIPKKLQWMLLLVGSFAFYCYSGWDNVAFMAVTILATFFFSRRIGQLQQEQAVYLKENKTLLLKEDKKAYKDQMKKRQKRLLILCLGIDLGILVVLKYTNFAIFNVNSVLRLFQAGELSFLDLMLPMGISFYTFQTVGYLVDVYRGKYEPQQNLGKLALFVSFFPQLIQGPISRYDDLSQTLYQEHSFDGRSISFGLQRILWGFFKKLVIADRILVAVNTITKDPENYQGIFVLVGMLFYAVQLYADFTGGIDITIGIAQVFGIRLQENFQRPFFSKSITEYWRRWHITMGTWFRDYVFYPISISTPMLNLSKSSREKLGDKIGKRVPVYLSTITVWFATGIWHGASWNFIVWGLMNCLVIIVSQECEPLYERFHARFHVRESYLFRMFQVVRTFLLMCSLRILDCYRDVGVSFKMFGTLFTKWNFREVFSGVLLQLGLQRADYVVLLVGVFAMIVFSLLQRSGSPRENLAERHGLVRYAVYIALLIAVITFGAYGIGYDSNQFIYNQF
ncbi:MAG: MBOAT family protein [Thermoclostridium sp.]|nr:MBOAT family protein [Thermoclostridium sp.]